ncbi:MAG: DUF1501 domain-containing protein [Verrucomicrobiales bacterium]|nr:DUF1501 domain-containing protein [Verrucomicrobiales bacterium]
MAINRNFNIKVNRRSFIGRSALGSLALGGLPQTLNHLGLMDAAAEEITLNDYKALVCIFLRGGCDMNNFLIPRDANPQANRYTNNRGIVAIPNGSASADGDDTIPLTAHAGDPFGFHPSLNKMGAMFNNGELSMLANCGNLSEVVTRANYDTAVLPVQLFSHSDQVTQWMAGSQPDKPFSSGWGGRIAQNFGPEGNDFNPQGQSSMLITVSGTSDFLSSPGGSVPQYAVSDNGAISVAGYGANYQNAITADNKYKNNNNGKRLAAFEDVMFHKHRHILEEGYNTVVRRARANEGIIGEALTTATATGVDFNTLFPDTDLGRELKMVAQLIAGRKCLGNNRQIFFVDQGGFDTHQDINADLPVLLTQLDDAIGAFNEAMKQLAANDNDFDYNNVIGFQASDFNRTWTPNGSNFASSGTDHAWGTNAFLFGGAVNGGRIFGKIPQLRIGGPDDVPAGSRGRWIPTTAVEQYSAVLAKWLGVPPADMDTIFPNLPRFADPFDISPSGPNLDLIDFLA